MGTVGDTEKSTVALLGGDTVVGHALSLLLRGAGYEVRVLEAPPTGTQEELLEGVDVLLISPNLTNGRREQSLSLLRGEREMIGIPVLELSSVIREELLHEGDAAEVGVVPWPISIEGLARKIENALEGALEAAVEEVHSILGDREQPLAEGEAAL